jgi:uncharacterized membrane protein YwzB
MMNMIGFARTATGLIEFTILALVFICAAWALIRVHLVPTIDDDTEGQASNILNIVAGVLAALVVVNFVFGLMSLSTNRIQRQDVDRSGIYQQMESNKSNK